MAELQRDRNLTVVMVAHGSAVAERADRVVHMLDGHIQTTASVTSDQASAARPRTLRRCAVRG